MKEEKKQQLQVIHDMRKPGKNGRPKHTQTEVAEELGVSQAYISQLERKLNIRPEKDASTPHIKPARQSTMKMTDETETESDDEDEWQCTNCGSTRWFGADEYAEKYGNTLQKETLTLLASNERVCFECGELA